VLPQPHEPSAELGTELEINAPGEDLPAVIVPETPFDPGNEGRCV